jgi:hypothetical protein
VIHLAIFLIGLAIAMALMEDKPKVDKGPGWISSIVIAFALMFAWVFVVDALVKDDQLGGGLMAASFLLVPGVYIFRRRRWKARLPTPTEAAPSLDEWRWLKILLLGIVIFFLLKYALLFIMLVGVQ